MGAKIPDVPYKVKQWLRDHPGEPIPDRQVFTQPTMMGPKADQRRRTIFYQYRADRGRRTMKGIDAQIAKAEQAVAGKAAVKSPTCKPRHRSSCWAPTTSCGRSRRASGLSLIHI